MTVQELIDQLSKIENKELPALHRDAGGEYYEVCFAEVGEPEDGSNWDEPPNPEEYPQHGPHCILHSDEIL